MKLTQAIIAAYPADSPQRGYALAYQEIAGLVGTSDVDATTRHLNYTISQLWHHSTECDELVLSCDSANVDSAGGSTALAPCWVFSLRGLAIVICANGTAWVDGNDEVEA